MAFVDLEKADDRGVEAVNLASNEAKKYQRDISKHLLVTTYKLGINEISIIVK